MEKILHKKVSITTFGCQMNVSDSEIVRSILETQQTKISETEENADLVLVNTCAIRENAELKIWNYYLMSD